MTDEKRIDFKSILQSAPDLYLILDTNFVIQEVSDAYAKATQVKREDILGHGIFEIFPDNPDDPHATGVTNLRNSLNTVLREKISDTMAVQKYDIRRPAQEGGAFEEHYWSPKNSPVLGKDNTVQYIIHRAEDVTEFVRQKKLTETLRTTADKMEEEIVHRAQEMQDRNRELQETKERFRLLIDGITDYAIFMLDPEGKITTWGAGAEHITGYTESEIIGKHFSCFYTPTAIAVRHPERELIIAKETGRYEEEGLRVRKNGDTFWANVIITPLYDLKGDLIGFGKITRDLTEHKKLDLIKNEFVSIVSHELRTPLTSIHGALNLILGGAVGSFTEKTKKLLDIADNNCTRLVRLVNDILDIEKIEAGKMIFELSQVSLIKSIKDSIAANQMYAEKYGVAINFEEPTKDFTINVDYGRLLQVLANLLSNAIKFSPHNGVINISVSQQDSQVRVSVTDYGCGIPEEFREKIFKKFSQVDTSSTRREAGTGLGLAISKVIIDKLGGELNFTSEVNEGSIFYFDLPIWSDTETAEPSPKSIQMNGSKILICEDDETQALYLATQLEAAGFATDIAYTAEAAKALLTKNNYGLLCLDLILPDQDGISLIKELRASKLFHSLPIVVVSMIAKSGKEILSAEAFEVIDWLDKPIDMNRLLKAIDSLKTLTKKPITKIIHIEDDVDAQQLVATLLSETAQVVAAKTIAETKVLLDKKSFDLAILDLVLPDGNGVELLTPLARYNIPVIVLAKGELDLKYANYVQGTLRKDETSGYQLLTKIEAVIRAHSKK